jgi:acetylornithine deacetylase/succinyl-diaminopimelate desuccinylase-like protein
MEMASDPTYGASSVAPTRVVSEPTSANVTPAALRLVLDWRNIPSEDVAQCKARLNALLLSSLEPDCQGRIELAHKNLVSYTGFKMGYPDIFPSFTTDEDNPWLESSRRVLAAALGRPVETGIWRFATDGGHLAAAGVTVIGLGPGDASVVHTVQERLPLAELEESAVAYVTLGIR